MTMLGDCSGAERPATAAWLPNGEYGYKVQEKSAGSGAVAVKAITVYWENGEMAQVPWLRIEQHSGQTTHVSAMHYEIEFPVEEE